MAGKEGGGGSIKGRRKIRPSNPLPTISSYPLSSPLFHLPSPSLQRSNTPRFLSFSFIFYPPPASAALISVGREAADGPTEKKKEIEGERGRGKRRERNEETPETGQCVILRRLRKTRRPPARFASDGDLKIKGLLLEGWDGRRRWHRGGGGRGAEGKEGQTTISPATLFPVRASLCLSEARREPLCIPGPLARARSRARVLRALETLARDERRFIGPRVDRAASILVL